MKVFDTIAATDIAERVVELAIELDLDSNGPEEDVCDQFALTTQELHGIVMQALEDYSEAQPEFVPPPAASHKRHTHKWVDGEFGKSICDGCGVDRT